MAAIDVPLPGYLEDEELKIFAKSVRRFFAAEVTEARKARWREAGQVDRDIWRSAGEMGFLGVSVASQFGGAGGDFRHEVVLIDEAVRAGVEGFALSLHNAVIAPYIELYGTDEQKRRWLPQVCSGERILAIAMTEPGAGSDLQGLRTEARREGDEFVISGQKTFISNGQIANLILVACKTDPSAGAKGISLIAVETENAPGFVRGRAIDKIGRESQDTSELFFDSVRVPAANLIGAEPNRGFFQLMEQLPQERMVIALSGMGVIERALQSTIDYCRQREVFGKPVLSYQNTQFKLAEAKAQATLCKVFLDHCVERLLEGRLDAVTASIAKLCVTEAECQIVDDCLQLHGGYGYTNEYPIGRMYRDSRIQRIHGGTSEIMKLMIARSL